MKRMPPNYGPGYKWIYQADRGEAGEEKRKVKEIGSVDYLCSLRDGSRLASGGNGAAAVLAKCVFRPLTPADGLPAGLSLSPQRVLDNRVQVAAELFRQFAPPFMQVIDCEINGSFVVSRVHRPPFLQGCKRSATNRQIERLARVARKGWRGTFIGTNLR